MRLSCTGIQVSVPWDNHPVEMLYEAPKFELHQRAAVKHRLLNQQIQAGALDIPSGICGIVNHLLSGAQFPHL